MKRTLLTLACALALAGCNETATTSSTGTSSRLSLEELAAADSTGSSIADTDTDTAPNGSCKPKHGPPPPPKLDDCASDLTTYCADTPLPTPPAPGTKPPEGDREKVKAAIDCLKTNEATLSSLCLAQLDNLPPPPPPRREGEDEGRDLRGGPGGPGGPGQGEGGGPGGHRPPPPPESVDCSRDGLSACSADANKNCFDLLPRRDEVSGLTADQIHQKVEDVVSCLVTAAADLTTACSSVVAGTSSTTASE